MKSIITILTFNLFLITQSGYTQDEFDPDSIISVMRRVAAYRMTYSDIGHLYNNPQANKGDQPNPYNGNYNDFPGNNWDVGAFMTGLMALYRATLDADYLDFAKEWAYFFNWSPFNGYTSPNNMTTNADHHCCGQTYCEIYMLDQQPSNEYMITPIGNTLKNMFDVVKPSPRILYGTWGWCDALYMSPPTIVRYCEAVGDDRLLDSLNRWWDDITEYLYDDTYDMFYRDASYRYPNRQCINGQPMFWSCGEAWVLGGLSRVLEYLPTDYQYRDKFETQFRDMCAAALAQQGFNDQFEGLWTTSMLDHANYPDAETSGSAFFCYAFIWGVRNGLLDSASYMQAANMAWSDLVKNIGTDGRLQRCQHVDEAPRTDLSGDINNSSPEGEGAFLLAGAEMLKLLEDNTSVFNNRRSRISGKSPVLSIGKSAISIAIDNPENSSLKIFDMMGKQVADLTPSIDKRQRECQTVPWQKNTLAPGVYSIRLVDQEKTTAASAVVIR